jgi:hypothetical protein
MGSFWSNVSTAVVAGFEHVNFHNLIARDRQVTMNEIEQLVQMFNNAQLDAFEQQFLKHSMMPMSLEKRLRCMELYSYFKICETARCNFRGFLPDGAVI